MKKILKILFILSISLSANARQGESVLMDSEVKYNENPKGNGIDHLIIDKEAASKIWDLLEAPIVAKPSLLGPPLQLKTSNGIFCIRVPQTKYTYCVQFIGKQGVLVDVK